MNWTELKWHSGTLATNSAWPRMRSFMALWEHSTVAAKAGSEKGQLPSIAEILSYTLNSMWLSDVECTLICLPIDPPRLFPASTDLMLQFTAEVLNLPVERLNAKITDPRMHAERVRHSRRICCYAAMLQISLPDHPLTWWYSQVFPDPLEYFVWVSSSFFCSGTCHRVGLTKNRHCRSVSDFFLLWQKTKTYCQSGFPTQWTFVQAHVWKIDGSLDLTFSTKEVDGASAKRWIQVDLNDLKPRHQLRCLDRRVQNVSKVLGNIVLGPWKVL